MTLDPESLWVVRNVNVGDDSEDLEYGGSRSEYFEVRYDGVPIRIPPGETLILPRYLADHYAKHLVDHMLARKERMMHDEKLRQDLITRIIVREADDSDRIIEGRRG